MYQLGVLLLSPLVGFAFLCSARGRLRIVERFGMRSVPPGDYDRWWHAASLGEAQGLLPLIAISSGKGILTVTSASALGVAVPESVVVRIAPFDCGLWYRLLFRQARFRTLVVTETELWPGMLSFAAGRGAKICWVNMRLRASRLRRYRMLRGLYEPLLRAATVFASSKADSERWAEVFPQLPAAQVIGNSKFDRTPMIRSPNEAHAVYRSLFRDPQRLLVLGSVHPAELEILIPGLMQLGEQIGDLQVVIAPRHRERDAEIAELLDRNRFGYVRRSTLTIPTQERIVLLDTFGELERCYSCAAVAYIGGSLVNLGGHNPLEASQYGCPVLMGPHTEVVEVVCDELQAVGALTIINSAEQFSQRVKELLADETARKQVGERAQAVAAQHRGASSRLNVMISRADGSEVIPAVQKPKGRKRR